MGRHHYERTSAVRMTESISQFMHDTLVRNLITENSSFSIIIDCSTDSSETNYIIVYIQAIESGCKPVSSNVS